MAHMMKHTKASCGHMFAHFDRRAEHISNENLDRTRTHLNYNLATHQQMDQGEFVRQRCSEVHCQNRKDVNVMVSWVVTAPKDLPEREYKPFFEASYDFLKKRYGLENVVSAYVHMDEVTPHMHFAFVPVVRTFKQDRKNPYISTEWNKVSAKECVNRYDLQSFHEGLQRHVSKALGHEVSILNEATKEGNKSIEELKRQSATERLQEANAEASKIVSKAQEGIKVAEDRVRALESEKTVLEGEIRVLAEQKQDRQLKINEITSIRPEYEKGLFGGIKGVKGVTVSEIETLKSMAIQSLNDREQLEKLTFEYERLKKLVPTMQERIQSSQDKARLKELESAFQRLPEHIRQQLLPQKSKVQDRGRER